MGWKYNGGLIFIISAVIVWVTSSEIIQSVFIGYKHPFAVAYIGTSMLVLHLPIAYIKDWSLKFLRHHWKDSGNHGGTNSSAIFPLEIEKHGSLAVEEGIPPLVNTPKPETKLDILDTSTAGFCIAPLWFLTEYLTNAALARTSVASTTLLSSTSGLFTLLIGAILGEESISLIKVISVGICMAGVAITAMGKTWAADESQSGISIDQKHSLLGDLFAILSALTHGLLAVMLKKIGGEGGKRVDMEKLFGYIGLYIIGGHWWLDWLLTAIGIEHNFSIPPFFSAKVEWIVLANSFVGNFLCDYLWALGVVWTNPLVASLGVSLTIPLAMVEDMIIHGRHYSPIYIYGSFQVFMGFVMVNLADWISQKLKLGNCNENEQM